MRRLAIYTFWEKNGVVREYVVYFLKSLKEISDEILVVVNGKINNQGKKIFDEIGVQYIQRENFGLDFSAWKAGLEYISRDAIKYYDEIILCNCSVYGPIYSFSDSFHAMECVECDFWGMTVVPEDRTAELIKGNPDSYVREHIQSYFIVLKRTITNSDVFWKWWDNLKHSKNFWDEVYTHETKFTEYLVVNGFKMGCYYRATSLWNPTIFEPTKLIKARMPLVKRKLFSEHHNRLVDYASLLVFNMINNCTNYSVNIIWDDLKGTEKDYHLKERLKKEWLLRISIKATLVRYKLLSLLSRKYKEKFKIAKSIE